MNIWESIGVYALGYLYALIIGQVLIGLVVDELWVEIGWERGDRSQKVRDQVWSGAATGYLESVLFVSSWLCNAPEFIGVWLVFKIAGRWAGHVKDKPVPIRSYGPLEIEREQPEKDEEKERAPEDYIPFVIGTGLSLIYGTLGAFMIKWIQEGDWHLSLAAGIALPVGTFLYRLWLKHEIEKEHPAVERERGEQSH